MVQTLVIQMLAEDHKALTNKIYNCCLYIIIYEKYESLCLLEFLAPKVLLSLVTCIHRYYCF